MVCPVASEMCRYAKMKARSYSGIYGSMRPAPMRWQRRRQRKQMKRTRVKTRRAYRDERAVPARLALAVVALSSLKTKRDPLQRAAGQKVYIIKKGVEIYYMPLSLMDDELNVSVSLQMLGKPSTCLKRWSCLQKKVNSMSHLA
ncbi:hypothetical protein D3P09_14955 [Paenibacillus pinisoli]|uniref:Uncharacterized protein n=1 Tax=Paenibacillus pinisoli TaxID=1276110 RepID=A0A3A6PGI9_9BACL|nr:hypothetical protein D3P09_14955 [Paenibacillus pinisoli]